MAHGATFGLAAAAPAGIAAVPGSAAAAAGVRAAIESAVNVSALVAAAAAVRPFAADAVGAGADAATLVATIGALNDLVTRRAVEAVAAEIGGVDLGRACWLAFGSQARCEQTLVTDQDNGLVFEADDAEAARPRWLAYGARVNEVLAACGQALCHGDVMAGQPACCLTLPEWQRCFARWIDHGSTGDLIAARIFFDLRPVAGRLDLAAPLAALLCSPAAATPRFVKRMADVVLGNHVALNLFGRVATTPHGGRAGFNLKTHGAALFADAARLWALAHGIAATATVPRLRAAAQRLGVPAAECDAWVDGFHAMLRIRLQVQRRRGPDADPEERGWAAWNDLDADQREALRRALRAARLVQQRITLDYCR